MANPTVAVPLGAAPRVDALWLARHSAGRHSFRIPEHWGLHAYPYAAKYEIDGVHLPIRPGSVGITPAGAKTTYTWSHPVSHVFAHLWFPPSQFTVQLPLLIDLGGDFASFYEDMLEAVAWRERAPLRASARIWDLFWRLSDLAPAGLHPAVAQACDLLERQLAVPPTVAELAGLVGVSHNQLTRLFRSAFGLTVVGWIRKRRVARAAYLLRRGGMKAAAIAAECGFSDLRHLNKSVRRELGKPPSALRGG